MTNQIIEKESDLAFLMGHRNTLRQFYGRKTLNLHDKLSYDEEMSRNHILRQWNSRWQNPDFDTNLKHLVPQVENDPVLTKISTTKELMRHVIEVLLDINPSLKKFAYNRSLTASPLCPCKRTEETAIHFLFSCKIWEPRNLYDEDIDYFNMRIYYFNRMRIYSTVQLCSITSLWHSGQHVCRAIGRLQVRISLEFWLFSKRRSL